MVKGKQASRIIVWLTVLMPAISWLRKVWLSGHCTRSYLPQRQLWHVRRYPSFAMPGKQDENQATYSVRMIPEDAPPAGTNPLIRP